MFPGLDVCSKWTQHIITAAIGSMIDDLDLDRDLARESETSDMLVVAPCAIYMIKNLFGRSHS